jgi:Bacterial regulatory proteins, luxR family
LRLFHKLVVLEGENQFPFPLCDSEVVPDAVQLALENYGFYRGVGGELGLSEITVKAHRGKVMEKMKAESIADLVKKMAERLRSARTSGGQPHRPPEA